MWMFASHTTDSEHPTPSHAIGARGDEKFTHYLYNFVLIITHPSIYQRAESTHAHMYLDAPFEAAKNSSQK